MRDPRQPNPDPGDELPPPPPLSSFIERSTPRLLAEALVGAAGGWLLAGAFGMPEARPAVALAGFAIAPLALLLTPLHGSTLTRAIRYGGALAVLGTLVVSFTGPGRERPVDELLGFGLLLLSIGTVGHALLLVTSGGDGGGENDDESTHGKK